MGGGGDGFGFVLDSDFATGESFKCKTYGNPVLVDKENGSFRIANVECWGFEGLFNKGNKSSQFQSESSNRNRWYFLCAISQWTRSCQVPFRSVVERILTMLCVPYTVLIVNNVHFNFLSGWHLFESPYYSYLSRQCSNPRISVFNSYLTFPVLHDLPLKDTGRTIRITSDYITMDGISFIMISSSLMCADWWASSTTSSAYDSSKTGQYFLWSRSIASAETEENMQKACTIISVFFTGIIWIRTIFWFHSQQGQWRLSLIQNFLKSHFHISNSNRSYIFIKNNSSR